MKGRFGQGAGAKMRKTRGGLDILFDKDKCTIREDDFVEHSITKKKYIFTFVDDLLRYFLNNEDKIEINSSKDLTSAWIKRWISKRILRKETIENIKLLGPASIKKNLSIN